MVCDGSVETYRACVFLEVGLRGCMLHTPSQGWYWCFSETKRRLDVLSGRREEPRLLLKPILSG